MAPLAAAVIPAVVGGAKIATSAKFLAAAGTGLSVLGQIRQSQAGQAQAGGEAAAFEAQAQDIERRTKFNQQLIERQKRIKSRKLAKEEEIASSRLQAKLGKGGASGSPVAGDLAAAQEAEFDIANLMTGEELDIEKDVVGFEGESSAVQARNRAALAKARKKSIGKGLPLKLAGTFLTGFSSFL